MDCFPDDILCEQTFLEQAVSDFVPGPASVRAPVQHRRDKKRFTEVLHNFCHEPLPWYKNLEHIRPQFPTAMRKWTEREGFRVSDHHNIEVTTRDQAQRTKKGSLRTSSGMVTYNAINRMHFELDAESLAKILREQEPHQTGKNGIRSGAGAGSSGKMWNVKNLEKAYQTQFRRNGSWTRQGVTFKVFLALFPKTFELFGADHSFVRIINKSSVCVIDCSEDAMVSLALACEKGYVERITPLDGTMKAGQDPLQLPQLGHVRAKTLWRSTSDPGLKSHTLPSIQESQKLLDASFKLPELRAATLPCLPAVLAPAGATGSDMWRKDTASASAEGGGGSLSSTVRLSDDGRSTFRVSFMADRRPSVSDSRSPTPAMEDSSGNPIWH